MSSPIGFTGGVQKQPAVIHSFTIKACRERVQVRMRKHSQPINLLQVAPHMKPEQPFPSAFAAVESYRNILLGIITERVCVLITLHHVGKSAPSPRPDVRRRMCESKDHLFNLLTTESESH